MAVELTEILANLLPPLHAQVEADLVFWTKDELFRILDEKVKGLAKRGVFVERTTIDVSAGTAVYDTPARHLSTLYVAFNGKPLSPISIEALEARDGSFATTAGTPTHYYADKIGASKIGFWPVFDAAAILLADEVEMIIHRYPTAADGVEVNSLNIPAPVVDALEVEVLAEAYGKEGDSQMVEVATVLKQLAGLENRIISGLWGTR